jgi:glutathione peroxidase
LVYPLLVAYKKVTAGKTGIIHNNNGIAPKQSFYDLSVELNSGQSLDFSTLKGRKVLIVNTASDCGYTPQYDELRQLQEQFKHQLAVIAFPSNDFKEQEKGSDEEISNFCRINYNITFPIAKKSVVRKRPNQHVVYQWLTNQESNGWNSKPPEWNFTKYLIDEKGVLRYYFHPAISPLGRTMIDSINRSY